MYSRLRGQNCPHQRALKIFLPFILLLAIPSIPPSVLCTSPSRQSHERNEQMAESVSSSWRNPTFTYNTNPVSQSKSPGSSVSSSSSSLPATSILSSWPLSLQPTFFSLLSSSSSSSAFSSFSSPAKDSNARPTFAVVETRTKMKNRDEDREPSPLSLAPYLSSYPYTLPLQGVDGDVRESHDDDDDDDEEDRKEQSGNPDRIFTIIQEEPEDGQRHHRDLSTSSGNQKLGQTFPPPLPPPLPSPSSSLVTPIEASEEGSDGKEPSPSPPWSSMFQPSSLCRHYTDFPPSVFQLNTCAFCYSYMRDEISLFGSPSKKIAKFASAIHYDPFYGPRFFRALNDSGTIIYANIRDPENPLYSTFANQNARQKWIDCCTAAEKCCEKIQRVPGETGLTSVGNNDAEKRCQPTWDGWQCWEETAAGSAAEASCPHYIYFMTEPPSCLIPLSKVCDREGDWLKRNSSTGKLSEWTNYATCASAVVMVQKKRAHVHVMAYAVSIIALIPALIVFFVYKQLRVHRIILHQNLFFSMLINGLLVIAFKTIVILNELSSGDKSGPPTIINQNGIGCRLLFILTKYSRMTNYMWMFCEGYYLHRLIAAAFAEQKSLLVFYLLGWVFPILPTAVYAGLRMYDANDRCWVVPEETYEWVLNIPSLLSLLINLGFLINIIRVLVTKLRASTAHANEPSQYRKAVRATLVLLPLFGLHFVVTIYRPPSGSGSCEWIELYYYVNYVLDGLQGFLVALIFCYLNGEVVALFKRTYSRWKEQHSTSCERQPSRLNNRNGRGRSVISSHYSSVPESPEPGSLSRLTIANTELNEAVADKDGRKKVSLMTNGKSNLNSHTIVVTNVQDEDNNSPCDWSEIKLDVGGGPGTDNNSLEMKQAFTLHPNLTSSSALGSGSSPSNDSSRTNKRAKNGASVTSEHQL